MNTATLDRQITLAPPPEKVLPSAKPRGTAKRLALFLLLGALTFGAVKFGRQWWSVGRFIESTDDSYVGGDVTVIAPKITGYITSVAVSDNQAVHAGDLLLKIDDRDYQAALAKTVAAVQAQEATLANLDAMDHLQEAVIEQANANIAETDAEVMRARDDLARYRDLFAQSATSLQDSQRADADYKKAVASGQKAHAMLNAALRQLAVIATQKLQSQAALAGAVADRDLAQLNLGYTELRAPIDGTVGNRSARPGAFAIAGSQLLSLVPAKGLWVDANFKENQLARLRPGLPVTVEADVLPGQIFRGHVASLAPATGSRFSVLPTENATGNFTKIVQRVPVRILLDGEGSRLGPLLPGLSVVVNVNGRPETEAPR